MFCTKVNKWKTENAEWKKKYENEARLRVEEVDALKKKFTIEVTTLQVRGHLLRRSLRSFSMVLICSYCLS